MFLLTQQTMVPKDDRGVDGVPCLPWMEDSQERSIELFYSLMAATFGGDPVRINYEEGAYRGAYWRRSHP